MRVDQGTLALKLNCLARLDPAASQMSGGDATLHMFVIIACSVTSEPVSLHSILHE